MSALRGKETAMFYASNTITVVPGKRFEAIAHLQKLAKFMCDTYGIPSETVGNAFGVTYQCHLVGKYESMAQVQDVNEKLMADPFFDQWYRDSVDLLHWQDTRCDLYEIYA